MDELNPFGDEGVPDKYNNTWVDYSYYILAILIL